MGAESQLIYSVSPNQQKDATASKGAHNFGELILQRFSKSADRYCCLKGGPQL